MDSKFKNPGTGLLADLLRLLALALAYRLCFWAAMPRVLDTADAIHYLEAAKHFVQGDFWGYAPKIPPLYPALTALLFPITHDLELSAMWVSLLASTLAVAPLYLLARDLHSRSAAQIAGVALAIWPWMADYGCRVGNESLALLGWLSGVWFFSRAVRLGGWRVWLAPLPFFALHLTRAEGLVVWMAAPIGAMLLGRSEGTPFWRRVLLFTTLSLGLVIANACYVRELTGQVTANYRIHFIMEEFDYLRFMDTAYKTLFDVFPVMLGPVLLVFLGAGLFRPSSDGESRDTRLELYTLLFATVQTGASWFVLSPAPRYLMAPIAVLATWSAAGIASTAQHAGGGHFGRHLRHLPATALVAAMLCGTAVTLGAEHLGRRPREPREYKVAGQWMREHLPPALIFTCKPQVGYYADMPSTGPAPEDTLDDALRRAREAGAQYVVTDERYATAGLRPLLNPEAAPQSLRLLYDSTPFPQSRIIVYELAESPAVKP